MGSGPKSVREDEEMAVYEARARKFNSMTISELLRLFDEITSTVCALKLPERSMKRDDHSSVSHLEGLLRKLP